jgi:hypothetical integral membrane protein (TIGR02206 family)
VDDFAALTPLHGLTVACLALAVALLAVAGRRLAGTSSQRAYERTLAAGVAALWLGYQVYDGLVSGWSFRYSLPLDLCDLAACVAGVTFWAPGRTRHALAWFWGMALSTQAVLTPDLAAGPATLAFWAFWLYHAFVVGAAVYVVAVRGFRPEWRDLQVAVGAGVAYAVAAFSLDAAFDLNYGYFGRRNPGTATLLDYLGPWPLRAVWMVLIAIAGMWCCWVPWRVASAMRGGGRPGGGA